MKILVICLIAVLLFSSAHTQTWEYDTLTGNGFDSYEGAQTPHVYSTVVDLTSGGVPTTGTQDTFSTTFTQSGAPYFGITDKIYYATAIYELGLNLNFIQKYLSVQKLTVNAGRTGYDLIVNYFEEQLGANTQTTYSNLKISLIIVGSSFSGESGYVESSYVYPRNGKLRDVLYAQTETPIAQFDFMTDEERSPFDYLPGEFSGKCGMIKATANSDRIVELSGCAYSRFYTFVTGYTIQKGAGVDNELDLGALVVRSSSATTSDPYSHPEITGANSIYKTTSTDTEVGLWVNYVNNVNRVNNVNADAAAGIYKTLRIQLSFVFVGIRAFVEGTTGTQEYPTQHLYRQDNFIHFGSKTGYTPVGGPSPTSFRTLTNPIVSANLFSELDPTDYNYPYTPVSTVLWANTRDLGFGNAFCGVQSVFFVSGSSTFTVLLNNPNQQVTISMNANDRISYQCVYFRRRNICDGTPMILAPLSGPSGYNVANSNFIIPVSSTTLSSGVAGFLFDLVNKPVGALGTGDIQTIYSRMVVTSTVFKISIALSFNAALAAAYDQSIKITAFGKEILNQAFTVTADYTTFIGTRTLVGGFYLFEYYVYSPDFNLNKVLIDYRSESSSKIDQIKVGVERFGNQLSGSDCLTTCPPKPGSLTGLDATTNPPTCVYCKQSEHLQPDGFSGCTCVKNYFFNATSSLCQQCATGISLCGSCSAPTVCSECTANAIATITLGVITGCTCQVGFYASGGKCLACPFGCAECTSPTSCTVCQENNGTRKLPTCGCTTGFYEDKTSFICPACSPRCQTCKTKDECLTCDQFANFVKQDTTCNCRTGFYELISDTDITCESCHVNCLTCAVSSLYCESCSLNDFRQLTGKADGTKRCECIQGYTDIQGTCVDKTCGSVDPFCQSCAFNTFTLQSQCFACGGNRIIIDNECKCKPGYYAVGSGATQTCEKCASGCQVCGIQAGALRCYECADRAFNNDDGSCSCPTGTVVAEASNNLYCQTCNMNCASCVSTPETCTACIPGFTLQNSKCVCGLGTYLSSSKTKCLPCIDNCNVCQRNDATGTISCITCATNYVYNGIQCALSCPNGKYNGGSECFACPAQCTNCLSKQLCLSCANGYFMFASSCRKSCPLGTIAVNSQCLACLSPCASCSKQATSCDSCVNGYLLFNNKCVKDCPPSTYFGDSSCLACSPRCLTCSGTSTNCVSCLKTQFLFNNDCFDVCPAAVVNGSCTDICPDGKYYENSKCLSCDAKCLTCKGSASNCTACANGYISYGGACLSSCPQGTFKNGNSCVRCEVSCAQCSDSASKCTKCASGYIQQGLYCVEKCQDGFYKDSTGYCKECGAGCQVCTSATSCSACFDPALTPSNGKCLKVCLGGSVYDGTKCVCTFGYLHENVCVSTCPSGYYADNKKCTACQYPCKDCISSANKCTTCISGYTFDSATNTCVRTNKCQYGQVEQGTSCIRACGSLFLYKDSCISECPRGYQDNGYGGCVELTTPSVCPAGKYQQGSTCVDYCSSGFFANLYTGICEACPKGCGLCVNSNHCVKCELNYIFENGACAATINCANGWIQFGGKCYQSCPAGTYSSGQSCSMVCPPNTYFWNPFCYATCPTNVHTDYACVNLCPSNYKQDGKWCAYDL